MPSAPLQIVPNSARVPKSQQATGGLYRSRVSTFANGIRSFTSGLRSDNDIKYAKDPEFFARLKTGIFSELDKKPTSSSTSTNTLLNKKNKRRGSKNISNISLVTKFDSNNNSRSPQPSPRCTTMSQQARPSWDYIVPPKRMPTISKSIKFRHSKPQHPDYEENDFANESNYVKEDDSEIDQYVDKYLKRRPVTVWYDDGYDKKYFTSNSNNDPSSQTEITDQPVLIKCTHCGRPNIRNVETSRQLCGNCGRSFDWRKAKVIGDKFFD